MGHYDDAYEFDNQEKLIIEAERLREDINELIVNISNINNLKQIKLLIKNIETINEAVRVVSNLNTIRINGGD